MLGELDDGDGDGYGDLCRNMIAKETFNHCFTTPRLSVVAIMCKMVGD
jgi:hypothetical protein